jgi:hypothetical protein
MFKNEQGDVVTQGWIEEEIKKPLELLRNKIKEACSTAEDITAVLNNTREDHVEEAITWLKRTLADVEGDGQPLIWDRYAVRCAGDTSGWYNIAYVIDSNMDNCRLDVPPRYSIGLANTADTLKIYNQNLGVVRDLADYVAANLTDAGWSGGLDIAVFTETLKHLSVTTKGLINSVIERLEVIERLKKKRGDDRIGGQNV